MGTAQNQQATNYQETIGLNRLQAPAGLESQARYSSLVGCRRNPLEQITTNTLVVLGGIAMLLVVIVLLELHIRALASKSLLQRQHLSELKSQFGQNALPNVSPALPDRVCRTDKT